jgi:hypothetical protein
MLVAGALQVSADRVKELVAALEVPFDPHTRAHVTPKHPFRVYESKQIIHAYTSL